MRVRHKVPSVFSLSMVDVLCCALGCVILIWLLNSKLSADEAAEQEETRQGLLAEARAKQKKSDELLAEARKTSDERDKAIAIIALLKERIAKLEKDRLVLLAALQEEKKGAADLKGQLAKSGEKAEGLEKGLKALLEKYNKEKTATVKLNADLAVLLARIKVTEVDLAKTRDREKDEKARAELLKKEVVVKERDLRVLTALLNEAKTVSEKLKKSLDKRDLELAKAKDSKLDLEKLLRLREVALEDAGKTLKKLESEKLVLKTAIDNRFAGIELSGKRVIFLVDTSGSMVLIDSKTDAPHKWREVRETVKKLMISLPGLRQYQIIAFSRSASFPLGSPGKWLDYDRANSPGKAYKALEAIKPVGGTNMYAALEQAFKYRDSGLDAVYLLSDGLPNLGEGLTAEEARTLSELEQGAKLGKYVRDKLKRDWNRVRPGKARVKIQTIGFFFESPDLGSFLWALARENDGSFVGMSKP